MSGYRSGVSGALQKTVILVAVLFFSGRGAPVHSDTSDAGCRKWRDSLVVYGVRSLDSGRVNDAARYFAGAFRCGMRKDSMYYYLAELYLRRMVLDTALVFNMAVEKAGTLPKNVWIQQRAKLYWFLGKKEKADSLLALMNKKGGANLMVSSSVSRTSLKLNPFTFVPQNFTLLPEDDTDDMGTVDLYYSYESVAGRRAIPWAVSIAASLYYPVPGEHFHDESTDTLVRYVGCTVGMGTFAKTPALEGGVRLGVHEDGKVDIYGNVGLSVPLRNDVCMSIVHAQRRSGRGAIDHAVTNVSLMLVTGNKELLQSGVFQMGHQYSRSAMFQNRYDSSGVYPPVPQGYIMMDEAALSDTSGKHQVTYFQDAGGTPAVSPVPRFYWDNQPLMFFLKVPKQSITASMQYGVTKKLPFKSSIRFSGLIKGDYYTKKLAWFSRSDKKAVPYLPETIFDDFAIVVNSVDGRYYLVPQRTQRTYFPDNMLRLDYHEVLRVETQVQFSTTIQKECGVFGEVFCSASFTKGTSSLSEDAPLVTFDRSWEIAAGWRKRISLSR